MIIYRPGLVSLPPIMAIMPPSPRVYAKGIRVMTRPVVTRRRLERLVLLVPLLPIRLQRLNAPVRPLLIEIALRQQRPNRLNPVLDLMLLNSREA